MTTPAAKLPRRGSGAFSEVTGFTVASRSNGTLLVVPTWDPERYPESGPGLPGFGGVLTRLQLAQQVQELLNSRCREAGQ